MTARTDRLLDRPRCLWQRLTSSLALFAGFQKIHSEEASFAR